MLPQPPAVAKCRHGSHCFLLGDAEEIGQVSQSDAGSVASPAEWRSADYVQEPTEDEYYEALRSGLATDRQQERNLRIWAWWRGNDAFRDVPAAAPTTAPSSPKRENLEALLPLLHEEDVNDLLMRVEVSRELGNWAQALEILDRVKSPEYAPIIGQLRALCQSRDHCVREFKLS
jgi:hypothetical protein